MVNIVPLQTTRGGGMLENQITIQKEIEDMGCMADVFTKSGVFIYEGYFIPCWIKC